MAVAYKMNFQMALDMDHNDLMSSTSMKDSEDYGGVSLEEFSRRIQADNDARYGDVIRAASWEDVGEAGW